MLETTWFLLWGVLWAAYFMLDGFDLGLGTLLPFVAKNEEEKRKIYTSIGPFWDGNEVWLITAGGVTFAAFPKTYAVMFSSLYSAMMLLLFSLILRGISIEFRGQVENPRWKSFWDGGMFVGSVLAALLLGITFGNIFQGVPIDGDGIFHGTLFTLLNPYGLLGGLLFLALFLVHGAVWLAIKTDGALHRRGTALARALWPVVVGLAVLFLAASAFATDLYANYLATPILFAVPLLCVAGLLLTRFFVAGGRMWNAWFASSLAIVGATMFGVVGLYPNLLPSSLDPAYSLTAFNSMSSPLTLKIMLGVTLAFVPVVIAYQAWVYRFFRHKVTREDMAYEEG